MKVGIGDRRQLTPAQNRGNLHEENCSRCCLWRCTAGFGQLRKCTRNRYGFRFDRRNFKSMLGREQQHGSRQESNKRKRHLFHRKFRQHRRLDIGRGNELRHYQFRHRFKQHRFGTPGWHAELLIHHVGASWASFQGCPFFCARIIVATLRPQVGSTGPIRGKADFAQTLA